MKIEKGTGGINDVDISWIPQETLNAMSTSIFIRSCSEITLRGAAPRCPCLRCPEQASFQFSGLKLFICYLLS